MYFTSWSVSDGWVVTIAAFEYEIEAEIKISVRIFFITQSFDNTRLGHNCAERTGHSVNVWKRASNERIYYLISFTGNFRTLWKRVRMTVFVCDAVVENVNGSVNSLAKRTFIGFVFSRNVETGPVIGRGA